MANTPDQGKLMNQLGKILGPNAAGMLDKLMNSPIGEHMQSWIGQGGNQSVTPDQVSQALGQDHMSKIADQTGTTPQQAAQNISAKLPNVVDQLSPDGQLPDPQTIQANTASGAGRQTQPQGQNMAGSQQTRDPRTNPPPL